MGDKTGLEFIGHIGLIGPIRLFSAVFCQYFRTLNEYQYLRHKQNRSDVANAGAGMYGLWWTTQSG